MKELGDKLTAAVKIATDLLFLNNPVGTSMGVFFGVVLHGITGAFYPTFQNFKYFKIAALNIFHYIAIGIFGFNVKSFITRNKLSPEIIEAIDFIDQQVANGRITKTEAKLQYREIVKKVVENVQLDLYTSAKVKGLSDVLGQK